eukprot:SAG25_NODE_615_length_6505_cov_8.659694_2_plen_86_part_00
MQNSQEQAPSLIQLARCLQQENLHIMPLTLACVSFYHQIKRPVFCSAAESGSQPAAIGRPAIRKVGTLGADFGSVRIALGKRPND